MSIIFDEGWEGAGYEESWTTSVGAGCTIDGDADPADVGSPDGWEDQCCKIIDAGGVQNYFYSQYGDDDVRYTSFEIVITDLSNLIAQGDEAQILWARDNALSNICWGIEIVQGISEPHFNVSIHYDGNPHGVISEIVPVEGEKYRFDVKWDSTNDLYAIRINGEVVWSGQLTSGHHEQGSFIFPSWPEITGHGITFYIDNIRVDDAWWLGGYDPNGFTQDWFEADFGDNYDGIGTTGYRFYKNDNSDASLRTTDDVVDLGNGGYGVPDAFVPSDAVGIVWDTGGGSPVYAREDLCCIKGAQGAFDPDTDEVNVGEVKGVAVTDIDDFKADVSGIETDIADIQTDITGLETDITFLKDIEGGKWELTATQMIFYKDDNSTEVARFDITKDADGNPIMRERL